VTSKKLAAGVLVAAAVTPGVRIDQIRFRAYANGKQIGPEVARTVNDETSNPNVKSPRKIGFGMSTVEYRDFQP
jgi:hypothetical protein